MSSTLVYEAIPIMSNEDIEAALSGDDPDRYCEAILSSSLYSEDWQEAQRVCLRGMNSDNGDIKRCSLIGLGHVVRIHGVIDVYAIKNATEALLDDKLLSGHVENLMSDINVFFSKVGDPHWS